MSALFCKQLLEKTLEECGDDIDAAVKRLHELCLGSSEEKSASVNHVVARVEQGLFLSILFVWH